MRNSHILHYSENNQKIEDGDVYLIDAGYEYEGSASDVTRTYPANGRFTGIQAAVYQVDLDTLNRTTELARPGVQMENLHHAADPSVLEGLKEIGLVKGSVEEIGRAHV